MVISSVRYVRVPEGNSNFTGGSSHVVYVDYILFFQWDMSMIHQGSFVISKQLLGGDWNMNGKNDFPI